MADEMKQGDSAIYRGVMLDRRGQTVEIVSPGDLIAAKFPDGRVIGCASSSLTRQEA